MVARDIMSTVEVLAVPTVYKVQYSNGFFRKRPQWHYTVFLRSRLQYSVQQTVRRVSEFERVLLLDV